MSITLTLTADDGSDMRRHLLNLLGLYAVDSVHTSPYVPVTGVHDPKHPARDDFGKIVDETPQPDPSQSLGQLFDEEEQKQARIEPEAPPEGRKARRPHRRVKPVEAPVAAPVAPQEDERDPIEEALDALTTAVDAEVEGYTQVDPYTGEEINTDPTGEQAAAAESMRRSVDNEMLKREVISSLADMFTAGNVKVVRHVLHKYGHGAKSFPEIEAIHFPEIKAALDRNEAA